MKLELSKKIVDFLQANIGQKFTARQIAEWILKTYPKECAAKKNRTNINSDDALLNQIVAEVSARRVRIQKRNPNFKSTEERPHLYYYTEKTDQVEVEIAESEGTLISSETKISENDLYLKLSDFLWSEFNIYSKRVDEKRSSNKRGPNGNVWLYPDVVAMEDLTADWHQQIKDCVQQRSEKKTKLWSFEVKILINRSNVRESFFQAVSNSSWANYGYLVAAGLQGSDTKKELQILSALHGIGFILLNADSPAESEVMIPAREKDTVDWDTANRITEENKDFLNYVKLIRQFYQTGDVRASDWDARDEA